VTVDEFDVYLWSIDLAVKYRGFSVNGEGFLRWTDHLRANGPLPFRDFFDSGYYVEAGYFIIPHRVEIGGRASQVFGRFGSRGAEYAGVVNWFIKGGQNWKITTDITRLRHSPAQNAGPNLRIGDDGVLVRSQLVVGF
jgi:hypothetical protein